VSEWGYAVEGLGTEKQAEYLLRALNTNRRSGIPLTIWYNWQEPITPWHSFGLLDVRGRPKPAYDALARQQRTEIDRRPAECRDKRNGGDRIRSASAQFGFDSCMSVRGRRAQPD